MFGSTRGGANAYAKVGLETGVVAASPHQLIVMLFEGALTAVNTALAHMSAGELEQKGKAISKAILIVDEGMRASLDKTKGGDIAANLDALYAYIIECLFQANLKNQPEKLEEARTLLTELKGAWDAIGPTAEPTAGGAVPTPARAFDSLSPRSMSFVSA